MILRTTIFALMLIGSLVNYTARAQNLPMDRMSGLDPRNIGPAGMSGRVTCVDVLLSDPSIMYLGSASGGLWFTDNAGDTWTPLFTEQVVASIGAVSINQNNPHEIWVGTGEGNPRNSQNSGYGIYRSLDGGKSWELMGLEQTRTIHRIIQHPDDPNSLVVAATGSAWGDSPHRGIYKTTDGGKTWRKTLFINNRTGASDLVVDPLNPNKFYAGMWEYRRWPWFFKSGGQGSGIYISIDGGETWVQRTTDDGLPKGELGRIGLSVAPSDPQIVYAYIESEKNAIYRSADGGYKWTKRSKDNDENIGDRPFYYADIYVDTQNENRVYSIATEVTVSEDGGKTWDTFVPGNKVHTDHHAWWSHPENNQIIFLGHDGGANITFDRGKNWRFFDNLPLAQFYHVRVDNEFPYNVYGGLQDNGSWKGPSQVWFKGGIRNMYWQRLSVGDGFDMVPDPENSEFGWSMGQQGNLFRYHTPTGQLLRVKPQHPQGQPLRFNWNTGIALDPFNSDIVYYGSQYLLKSNDMGASWQVISPDLTTNDPDKQDQLNTGGLSYDNTGAENHTTIISIAPSTLEEGLIWVGTDDGKLQLTRDGGSNWIDLSSNIKQVPPNTWIPHIHASKHQAGEAFVVFDDHRRDNWQPYIFRTLDYGQSWTSLVDENDVWGFVYVMVQDNEVPGLYYCGTESGLYLSVDAGANWTKWTNGFPTVPVMDLAIQERDGDLVIGTFGRAIWILDDLTPLRDIAKHGLGEIMSHKPRAFKPKDAYLMNIGESFGYRQGKIGDALFEGENRPYGALISYYLPEVIEDSALSGTLSDSVRITIRRDGTEVRTLYKSPKPGIQRINWTLSRDALRYPQTPLPDKDKPLQDGILVAPGRYKVMITYNGDSTETELQVRKDPRLEISSEAIVDKESQIAKHIQVIKEATKVADALREAHESIKLVNKKQQLRDSKNPLIELGNQLSDTLESILDQMYPSEDIQGIYRDPNSVVSKLQQASYLMESPQVPWSKNQQLAVNEAYKSVEELIARARQFFSGPWKQYRQQVDNSLLLPDFKSVTE